MEKKTLLAIIISIAILIAWDVFFIQPRKPQTEPVQTEKPQVEKQVQEELPSLFDPPSSPSFESEKASGEAIYVETPLYRATWNTKGAQIVSFQLKEYKQTIGADAPPVEMVRSPFPQIVTSEGFSDAALVFEPSHTGLIHAAEKPFELVFTSEVSKGIILKKIYRIDPLNYLLEYRTEFINNTMSPLSLSYDQVLNARYPMDEKKKGYAFEGPVLLHGKHLEEFKVDKVKTVGTYRDFPGEIKWFGIEEKYFLHTIIPLEIFETQVRITRTDENIVSLAYSVPTAQIRSGSSQSHDHLIFLGPKNIKILKDVGFDLHRALDFGFFDLIAKPLLISMNWIQSYVGSYGLSIIILTIFIKIILYPLTFKSFASMKGLQKIQPLMKELQAKYKDDKQKLNQELMKLYSEHKINPLGGCLPMLLQIPILFALYKVFYSAIELRHTPFHIIGTWLPDLSAKDPYFITPVLMGLSQFVMQKMTPTAGDPTQQKIMLMMPVVFTFLFLSFPSGLVLYWLVSNILSIIQQAYINRKLT
ncbi:MAG TPA: membrane protein insertase YidC [Deltaproteobacteria bacterium]|nr:membrane protein insertase YidC [Deltaproteobacteria bacterium]